MLLIDTQELYKADTEADALTVSSSHDSLEQQTVECRNCSKNFLNYSIN